MNKSELVAAVSQNTGLNKSDTAIVINGLLETISAQLGAGEKVSIQGFGVFSPKVRAARTGRNPKTGEAVEIPEKRVVKFSAGKGLI